MPFAPLDDAAIDGLAAEPVRVACGHHAAALRRLEGAREQLTIDAGTGQKVEQGKSL